MNAKRNPVFTNVHIFGAIADAAYERMSDDMDRNVRPMPDGSPGTVKTFDPEQQSFKDAMISIVFSCIWLEALLHLLIVRKFGRKCFRKVDRRRSSYGKKLSLLGCSDDRLLEWAERLRKSRNQLVHENAHLEYSEEGMFQGEVKTAQDEAENARRVMVGVRKWCEEAFEIDPP
ncbi:MAG: hypothetical protein OXG44_17155 [Gammaproteobacteria bacterium]|nr:hypothetical protein [Gammaproteobacteria bacterium]